MAAKSHGTKSAESQSTETTSEQTVNNKKFNLTPEEDYGYYFYPDRDKDKTQKPTFWDAMWMGRKVGRKLKCENNVVWCVNNHPLVKLMMRALRSHGCPVDLGRHISCEPCLERVQGGFDPSKNQIVVCENNARSTGICCNVLAHEFVHAFDSCRAHLDFKNLEHLACTEIRAANFMHCSYLAAVAGGEASFINIKQRHAECVKTKALMSVLMVRNVTVEKARQVVDKVFDKCYKDLEPLGRIPRKGSRDKDHALLEGAYYGYV